MFPPLMSQIAILERQMQKYIIEIGPDEDDESAISTLALAYQEHIDNDEKVIKSLYVFSDRMTSALIAAGYCSPRDPS